MGRAYAVREKKIKEQGAQKGKIYTTYAKEIYLVAKKGTDPEGNLELKRLIEKAKHNEVPNNIIERAIDKAKGNNGEDYKEIYYEGFGPGSSTFVIKTLTDNVNRTVGEVRAAFNKVNKSLGVQNSVLYNYDHLAILGVKSDKYDELFEALLDDGIDIEDLENEDGLLVVTGKATDYSKIKDCIEKIIENPSYELDEVGYYPKDKATLEGEDKEIYDKLFKMLNDIDDVTAIYTNVD